MCSLQIHLNSLSCAPENFPLQLHVLSLSLSPFKNTEFIYLYVRGYRIAGVTSLKKVDSPSPGSHQLPIAPQLGLGLHEVLPINARILTGVNWHRSCAFRCSHWEFMCTMTLSCSANNASLEVSISSGSPSLPRPSSMMPWYMEVWSRCLSSSWLLHCTCCCRSPY